MKTSAPGKAGIIGNPTDMYGGSAVSCFISERAHCRLSSSDELTVNVSGDTVRISDRGGLSPDGGRFDLVKAALQALEVDPAASRFSMRVWTDVPEQAGLGGSGESNEKLIEAALAHGAFGTKPAGAGHGGTIIALTDDPDGMAEVLLETGAGKSSD